MRMLVGEMRFPGNLRDAATASDKSWIVARQMICPPQLHVRQSAYRIGKHSDGA